MAEDDTVPIPVPQLTPRAPQWAPRAPRPPQWAPPERPAQPPVQQLAYGPPMRSWQPVYRPAPYPFPEPRPGVPGLWFPGRAGVVRYWDGRAWTTPVLADPAVPATPWHTRWIDWLRSPRTWVAVVGLVVAIVVVVEGTTGARPNRVALAGAGALGCGALLLASAWTVWRRVRVVRTARWRIVLGWGIPSGLVASAVAVGLEFGQSKLPGFWSSRGTLYAMAGPIEETAKLLVPVLLWFALPRSCRDPRTGFGLAFVSGATFGLLEGIGYVSRARPVPISQIGDAGAGRGQAIALLVSRSGVELLHPWLCAAVAAAAWLAAYRNRSRVLNGVAVLAWLAAAGLHSFQDAVVANIVARHIPLLGLLGIILVLVTAFQLMRRASRELAPPESIPANPPRWRPRAPRNAQPVAQPPSPQWPPR